MAFDLPLPARRSFLRDAGLGFGSLAPAPAYFETSREVFVGHCPQATDAKASTGRNRSIVVFIVGPFNY